MAEPLIEYLQQMSPPDNADTIDTVLKSTGHIGMALWYLRRGGDTDCNRKRADTEIDCALSTIAPSSRVRVHVWSRSPRTKVYTFDHPLGVLDSAIALRCSVPIIVKEYIVPGFFRDCYDRKKLSTVGDMYARLHALRVTRPSVPLAEISARTEFRQICARIGTPLCAILAATSTQAPLLERLLAESDVLCNEIRQFGYASRALDYHSPLAAGIHTLTGRSRNFSERVAIPLADRILSDALVPQIDPKPDNIVLDGARLRFIDLEKAPYFLVSRHEMRAQILLHTAFSLPLEERLDRLGTMALPAALYYCVRRLDRCKMEMKSSSKDAARIARYAACAPFLRVIAKRLRHEFECANLLANLSTAEILRRVDLQTLESITDE
jgi:hypothetical protein